jgi:pimeloyl-ACP methyl ester carboxylesterase
VNVWLHAFPLDGQMWGARDGLVVPSLYALGDDVDLWAERVLAQVEGDVVAIGASMGGYAALALARRAPERAGGLVLVGARAEADSEERRAAREDMLELIDREGTDAVWREMHARLFGPNAPVEAIERARAITMAQTPDDLANGVRAMRDRPDSSDVVRSFAGRLLVCVGEHDPFFPVDEAKALAASAPNGRAEVFAGAGHLLMLEQPQRFDAVVGEFLAN